MGLKRLTEEQAKQRLKDIVGNKTVLSGDETALVLGVTKGRVTQMKAEGKIKLNRTKEGYTRQSVINHLMRVKKMGRPYKK